MDYDVVVVGSGFGGSVAALRLTEKGYSVGVLEAGRRFDEKTLPKTSWRLRDFLWAPALGLKGIQRIHLLRGESGVLVLAGAGVGGGSLVYANTLYEPLDPFFTDPQWAHITDWKDELAPYYDQAKRMLGAVVNPSMTPADEVMRKVAERMGVGGTFHLAPVGVFFGEPGVEVDDPYFGGVGPRRRGCTECGECMTGCRHGAKNMLTKNYLYLAEKAGAKIHPETTVVSVRPITGGYELTVRRTGVFGRTRTITAGQVVFAAGTYGTQKLLHRLKRTTLPNLSPRLGELTRTNSEALLGFERPTTRGPKLNRGVAITSSFHPDAETHIEPVRYGDGSNMMALLRTLLVDGGGRTPRWARFLGEVARRPHLIPWLFRIRHWSERTVIALVMQAKNNSITVRLRGGRLRAERGHGEPNPTWIPAGHRAVRIAAEEVGGLPGGTWLDLFNIPATAHFIGGCVIGDSPETGVIDPYHRVYGYEGLHIVDGSAISANLGVNPSLTITAQAERAMAFWPNKGEPDPRPPLGSPYVRIKPVPPAKPVVPPSAPGALRLPIVDVT
ncbi:GMC family oxidoreductase [Thermobispora bispora]|uniref:Cholesterol oxidase n=1 Tax=Thermobispora bispora (strain ATCC 19993 / DSM 43833 / CBS 139.67 / JCM 10125 / KCTC 9307 / NBRC 14880 / R51) TaxID=469371 RepID=D6Y5K8_THEBD|nr:GMC family oxidoreductase [Thermobispora bispora]ADG87354.1 FAD dependent oxidoreductase [Thermobispora bispora DSM 43833]